MPRGRLALNASPPCFGNGGTLVLVAEIVRRQRFHIVLSIEDAFAAIPKERADLAVFPLVEQHRATGRSLVCPHIKLAANAAIEYDLRPVQEMRVLLAIDARREQNLELRRKARNSSEPATALPLNFMVKIAHEKDVDVARDVGNPPMEIRVKGPQRRRNDPVEPQCAQPVGAIDVRDQKIENRGGLLNSLATQIPIAEHTDFHAGRIFQAARNGMILRAPEQKDVRPPAQRILRLDIRVAQRFRART